MYEYEMDPTRTVDATERTRNAGRMDGWKDGQMDRRVEWNQYTPNIFIVHTVSANSWFCKILFET